MMRQFVVLWGFLVTILPVAHAESPTDLNKTIAVQRAISAAREHLRRSQATQAIQVLEAELINADGNGNYLKLLKDAYGARIRELRLAKADNAKIAEIERRLELLDGKDAPAMPPPPSPMDAATTGTMAKLKLPATPTPPAIPTAPDEMYPTAPPLGPAPVVAPTTPPLPDEPPIPSPNPFLDNAPKAPREEPIVAAAQRATAAFAQKDYATAAQLYATAEKNQERLDAKQRDEWAYARLHQVATTMNRGEDAPATLTSLAQEVEAALRTGSERLQPFGEQLRQEIRRRGGPTTAAIPSASAESTVPGEWQVVKGKSVRVLHQGKATLAAEIALVADTARTAMYERWAGPAAAAWSPLCDIYVHASGADYAKATNKPADHLGHCTVNIKGGMVIARRVDVRADDPTLLDATLPHEMTHMVLADLFAEQPLPRWAVIGIAALAESPENVARYRRAVPELLHDRKMFAVGPFMEMPNYPADPKSITAFYAESVSLVSYLVEQRGPKAFIAFLREAPRRGYAKALTTHYGFRDPAELQERWIKAVMTGERN